MTQTSKWVPSSRNKRNGKRTLFAPIIALIVILILRVAVGFFTQTASQPSAIELQCLGFVFDFLALLCVIVLIPAIPLGIVLMKKKELATNASYDQKSGKGTTSEVPQEIRKWNWGAAGLGLIWGIYHGVWISLLGIVLSSIPLVNLGWWVLMGMKGSQWAWASNRWESVEQFEASQRNWKPWGIVFFILGILGVLGSLSKIAK